jgi:hypothetical protein
VATYKTNRGKRCEIASTYSGGWVTANAGGTFTATVPGNLFMALASGTITGDTRDLKLSTDVATFGLTLLTVGANGYTAPVTLARNSTVWPLGSIDDTNDQESSACSALIQWNATGAGISASAALLLDGDQSGPSRNVLGIIDFGGTQVASSGQTFTIQNTTVRITKAFGET